MKKYSLIISITFNVLLVLLGGTIIHKTVGINYVLTKLNIKRDTDIERDYGSYYNNKKSLHDVMPKDTSEIIFLGNSITDFCDWQELFRNSNIKNRGIGGDIIHGVMNRLDEVVESNPKKIFLMIGNNDLGHGKSVELILSDYERLVKLILKKTPESELYLQSILPTNDRPKRDNNDIVKINNGIVQIAQKYSLTYINLFDLLKTDNNELNMNYSFDGLHLNGNGYLIWKNAINEFVIN
jgi:lysophospholipase L1-like esterase